MKHDLDIQSIGSVFTDGAPAMLGNNQNFLLVETGNFALARYPLFLHRHALASKTLLPKLKNVLNTSVKTINLIRGRVLNHRLFKSLCQDFGSEHLVLLFYAEVRWLSHGKAFTCFFKWREEVKALLNNVTIIFPKK